MRATAIEQLAQGYKDHPDTLPLLQQARSDHHWWVRREAIKQLAQGYKDHRDTLALLQQSARSDTDWEVRLIAIEQLAQGWHDRIAEAEAVGHALRTLHPVAWPTANQSWLLKFLCDRTLHDPYGGNEQDQKLGFISRIECNPRQVALNAILKYYPNHPDTLALLQQSARSDPDSLVRRTAIEQLAEAGQDQPWLFEFLCDRILHDPFERKEIWIHNPRQTALEAILKYYPNHSQTQSLLLDRAEHDPDHKLRKFAEQQLEW